MSNNGAVDHQYKGGGGDHHRDKGYPQVAYLSEIFGTLWG